jgi:predicted nucleic acid-binding protein
LRLFHSFEIRRRAATSKNGSCATQLPSGALRIVNITDRVVARAVELLERWPLRTLDSLHVACAAEWSAELFVSADERQCVAARRYGLRIEQLPLG